MVSVSPDVDREGRDSERSDGRSLTDRADWWWDRHSQSLLHVRMRSVRGSIYAAAISVAADSLTKLRFAGSSEGASVPSLSGRFFAGMAPEGSPSHCAHGVNVCCVFLCRDDCGRLLLHRRTAACRDEAGAWDCGGGRLEFGEDPLAAVRREILQEYQTRPRNIRPIGVRTVLREQDGHLTHWLAIVFEVLVDPSTIRVGEPDKMADLRWFEIDGLPAPLHSQLQEHLSLLPQWRERRVRLRRRLRRIAHRASAGHRRSTKHALRRC